MNSKIWIVGHKTKFDTFGLTLSDKYNYYNTNNMDKPNSINELNRFLSEFVAMYYVYNNHIESDYISFCHYRRIIREEYILYSKLDEGYIQYYRSENFNSYSNPNNNLNLNKNYFFINWYFYNYYKPPKFILDDFNEFLYSQNIISQKKLIEINSPNNFNTLIYHEIYSCTYKNFERIYKFIMSFIYFIINKYNLDLHMESWREHFLRRIIPYYQKHNKHLASWLTQNIECIYLKNTGYRLTTNTNIWRLYSYQIEFLISIFILANNPYCVEEFEKTVISR